MKLPKIATTFNMNVFENTASQRLDSAMKKKKLLGRGKHSDAMEDWMLSGFLLDEMGSGIMKQWLSMEEKGELDGLSNRDKMLKLAGILNFFAGSMPTVVVETPAPTPEPTPEPIKKPRSRRKNPNEIAG